MARLFLRSLRLYKTTGNAIFDPNTCVFVMANYLGIEIGGTKLQLILADENMIIKQKYRYKVDQSKGARGIQANIEETLQKLGEPLTAAAVGFGGPIDRESGRVFKSYHIEGWTDFSLKHWLRDVSRATVRVDNDANVAALGEAMYGAGKGVDTVFYVTLGSGVGAGLVQGGSIYHGAVPGETEFGHVRLDRSGKTVQSSCSGWAVDGKIRDAVRKHPESLLASLTEEMNGNEATMLGQALKQDDPVAVEIFESTMDDFAFGLSHAIHVLHPDVVVLGGGLSLLGERLRAAVETKCKKYLMDAFQSNLNIRLAALKEDAVTVGAVALAMQQKFDNE